MKKYELLTRKEAAEILGITSGTLSVWTSTKRYNLPIVKIGRSVKYKLSDLEEFIEQRTLNYNSYNSANNETLALHTTSKKKVEVSDED